jgi:hypothetical protein
MFNDPIIENKGLHFVDDIKYLYEPATDRTFLKIVSGVCPPNQASPGYIVIAGLQHPAGGQTPLSFLIDEGSYPKMEDLLLAMSRCHYHYKCDTHYVRFRRSKQDERVFDDFLRHIQRYNLEAVGQKRMHIVAEDAPWTTDRGQLKFILEKMRQELVVGKRNFYWDEENTPSSVRTLNGVEEWENTKDENTMLGALCYAFAGLMIDRPSVDSRGVIRTGSGVKKTKGDFNPMHGLERMLQGRRK